MIKFCPMCGNKLSDRAKICRGCGLSVIAYEEKLAKLSATLEEEVSDDKANSTELSLTVNKAPKDNVEVATNNPVNINPEITEKPLSNIKSDTVQKETTLVTVSEPAQNENTFSILGYEHTFNPRFVTYNSVHKIFIANAYKKRKEFTAEYNERVHNFDEFYSVGLKIFEKKIFETADLSVKVVKQIRGISIAPEEMLRICYNERLVQMDTFLRPLQKVYDKIAAAAEQLAAYRGLERSSRSRWEGGGFGFTGAIKGAIQAGILNMATDAVRGIGDSFTDAGDRRKIAQLKAKALNDDDFYNGQSMLQYTENTLENFCLNFFDGIMPIIDLDYVLTKADVNLSDQIIHKIANYRPYDFEDLTEAIFRNPFEPVLYLTIFNLHTESYHELERLAEYVGLKEKFLDMLSLWYLKEIIEFAPTEKDTIQTIQDKKNKLVAFRPDLNYGVFDKTKKLMNDRLSSFEHEIHERNSKKDEGCFITTAVCLSFGKADDCYELMTFRRFRDTWLINQPDGKNLIAEYYAIAPTIVDGIKRLANPLQLYQKLWNNFLMPCLENIERGKFSECKKIYIDMVKQLKEIFIG